MTLRIKTKFLLAFSLLIGLVFALAAYLLINEKKLELADDIYFNTLAFVKLTAPEISSDYDLYLAQNSFIYFNRQISDVFEKNIDINQIQVVSYSGEILYDSEEDTDKLYEGKPRMIEDEGEVDQVQSEFISVRTQNDQAYYISEDGDSLHTNKFGEEVPEAEEGILYKYFVAPGDQKTSVRYFMDYRNLKVKVANMQERIIYLSLFGFFLGIMFSYVMAYSFTKPILRLVAAAKEIAKGNFMARVTIKSNDEFGFLGKAFNAMARDLQKSVEAKIYQERLSRELELAADIQKQIVPENVPQVNGLEIAAGLLPAGDIGGDMYDFLPLNKDRLLMYLGDVTGHGVPAGIVSSIASALFYGYSVLSEMKSIIIEVNRVFNAKTLKNIFMTLCLIDWDALNKKLSYVSAGHEQLIHYQAKEKKCVLTPAGGLAIGMIPDVSKHVKLQEVDFQPGDFVLCYSDGIPEAWRSETEQYGLEALMKSVDKYCMEHPEATASSLHGAVINDLVEFTQGYEQMDDVTLLVLKRV